MIIKLILATTSALLIHATALSSETKLGVMAQSPSPAPSGDRFVFTADFDGPTRLWTGSLTGLPRVSKLISVPYAQGEFSELEPAWSPDGRRIAFVLVTPTSSDLWVVNSDGASPVTLTSGAGAKTNPAWSPDGLKIAFVSDREGTKDVWTVNADGAGTRRLTTLPGQENRPGFSPAGDRLVFSYTNGGAANLYTIKIDGSAINQLTSGNANDWEPTWGPSGIVFTSNRQSPSGRYKLWFTESNGANLRRLGDVAGHDPVWLRNGEVLFADERADSWAVSSISKVGIDGRKQSVLDVQGYGHPIDIRPGKNANHINPVSSGRIEVAILSTQTLDAPKTVNTQTLTFGALGHEQSLASCEKKHRDVNGDGRPDLVCRFITRAGNFGPASRDGVARFKSVDGLPYEGRDSIVIVGTEDADDHK